jgi:hypothetical protein
LSDEEIRRRLAQVYTLLIELGRRKADSDAPAEPARIGAGADKGAVLSKPAQTSSVSGARRE